MPELQSSKQIIAILFSGKKNVGKDYLAELLIQYAWEAEGLHSAAFACADSCKLEFSQCAGLDFNRLINERNYKEQHRVAMTIWYHRAITENPNRFRQIVIRKIQKEMFNQDLDFVVIKDIRRLDDLKFFFTHPLLKTITIRIESLLQTRIDRGLIIDEYSREDITETELDDYQSWHLILNNDSNDVCDSRILIKKILQVIHQYK